MLEESDIPNCYHYGANPQFIRSRKIAIVIGGVRVPIILDTGAEVSILSSLCRVCFQVRIYLLVVVRLATLAAV